MSALAFLQSHRWLRFLLLTALFAGMSWGLLAPNAFRFLRTNPYSPIALLNDVMLHSCTFAAVTLTFSLVFGRGNPKRLQTIANLMAVHGLATELMQAFIPTRTCDPFDLTANFVGVAIGSRLAVMYFREQQVPVGEQVSLSHVSE